MECVELQGSLYEGWKSFVERVPGACLGHDLAWRQAISEGLGHKPHYLVAADNGRVVGALPLFEMKHFLLGRRLVSVPVLDRAGILAESEEAKKALADRVDLLASGGDYKFIQLRYKLDRDDSAEAQKAILTLDISPDANLVWKSFKDKVRNQVRKAEKSGLGVEVGGAELLPHFYEVYARNMRDLGVPALPVKLFEETLSAFGCYRSKVITVMDGREPVGGCIEIFFRNTASVPWASSSRQHFEKCPNNLLYWAAIRTACEMGCEVFDFGRSTRDTGPYNFKKQWGAVPWALNWEYYLTDKAGKKPDFTTGNPKYKLLVRTWQRLPVPVASALGPIISSQVA